MAIKSRDNRGPGDQILFPSTDGEVEELIPEFCWTVGRAAAATVLEDGVLTVAEYEGLAECASALEGLSSYPGLMSYLILQGITEDPKLEAALKQLKKSVQELPLEARQAIFEAANGLFAEKEDGAVAARDAWARALGVVDHQERAGVGEKALKGGRWLVASGQNLVNTSVDLLRSADSDSDEAALDRASEMARVFADDELAAAVSRWRESECGCDRDEMDLAVARAADRAFGLASARLKSAQDLQQQGDLAGRFLQTTQALVDQVSSRLRSIEARLQLQNEMFREDLDAFIASSLDSLEIEMNALMKGRENWTDPGVWNNFKERAACGDLMARFAPIRSRYLRLFDQWQRELGDFSQEAATIRATVLSSVDRRAFTGLVPSEHSAACIKCALDRVSDATLGVSLMGALGVGAAIGAGAIKAGVVVSALSNPVGATIGAVVGAAALWKAAANIEGRKEKLVKNKRAQIRKGLETLLATEGLDHEKSAAEIYTKFVQAAVEQYTPLIVEARLWTMKAKLEPVVTERVLEGTRSFLRLPG